MSVIVDQVAKRLGISRESATTVVGDLVDRILEVTGDGGELRLSGLGTFRRENGHVDFEPEPRLSTVVNHRFAALAPIPVDTLAGEAVADEGAELTAIHSIPFAAMPGDAEGLEETEVPEEVAAPDDVLAEGGDVPDDVDYLGSIPIGYPRDDYGPDDEMASAAQPDLADPYQDQEETTDEEVADAETSSVEGDDSIDYGGPLPWGTGPLEKALDPGSDTDELAEPAEDVAPSGDVWGMTAEETSSTTTEDDGEPWSDMTSYDPDLEDRPLFDSKEPVSPEESALTDSSASEATHEFAEADLTSRYGVADDEMIGKEADSLVSDDAVDDAQDRDTESEAGPWTSADAGGFEDYEDEQTDDYEWTESASETPGSETEETPSDAAIDPAIAAGLAGTELPRVAKARSRVGLYAVIIVVLLAAIAVVLYFLSQSDGLLLNRGGSDSSPQEAVTTTPEESGMAGEESAAPETQPFEWTGGGIDRSLGGYTLVVSSQPSEAEAAKFAGEFAATIVDEGIPVDVLRGRADGRNYYRVGVGQFRSSAAAARESRRLSRMLPEGAWVLRIRSNM